MNLGVKALDPRYLTSDEKVKAYFDLDYRHFRDTCESLDLDTEELDRIAENVRENLENGSSLEGEEEKLFALIMNGDVDWAIGIIQWQHVGYRAGLYLPEKILRWKIKQEIHRRTQGDFPQIKYSNPSEIGNAGKLRKEAISPAILHLEWFRFLTENLEVENSYNF